MSKTKLTIRGDKFDINGAPVYSEIPSAKPEALGLLMNARFIQGVFDDASDPRRFARYGFDRYDPDENTDRLIAALPQWHYYGLRAFTVGFQGGGSCYTLDNYSIVNNPYSADGTQIDAAYLSRMGRLIRAADALGMVVVVSLFYGAQMRFLQDDRAVKNAVKSASNWLRSEGFTNVIVEIANEFNVPDFKSHAICAAPQGEVELIGIAQRESGGMPVGTSMMGGFFDETVAQASDVILLHGNRQSRQFLYNEILKAKAIRPARPIVVNEDSQAVGQLGVTFKTGVSWGYYNNATKQEPPARWEILPGEDAFFAHRMADGIGIATEELPLEEQFYLAGTEPWATTNGKRWIRLASLYPETIDYVEFFRNGEHVCYAFDESFSVGFVSNWRQNGIDNIAGEAVWRAEAHLTDGRTVVKEQIVRDSAPAENRMEENLSFGI